MWVTLWDILKIELLIRIKFNMAEIYFKKVLLPVIIYPTLILCHFNAKAP